MKRIAVVVSQGQSANPAKRQLEEDIVAGLLMEPGIDVVVIPHLYDLKADGTGMLALRGIMGNMIVLSWLYERAARWTGGIPPRPALLARSKGRDVSMARRAPLLPRARDLF